jgi:thiol-disulfide isomerase/thioredoxin
MKRLMMIAALALSLVGCAKEYVVRGTIEGYAGEVKLMANKSTECFASTTTEDGSFEMKVDVKAPLFANLVVGDKQRMVFVEEGTVTAQGTLENWDAVTVGGTKSNDNFAAYRGEKKALLEAYYAATDDESRAVAEQNYDNHTAATYEANKDNLFGLYLLATEVYYGMTPDEILEAVKALPKALQKSHTAITLREVAEAMKRVDVGQQYIELELPDKDGNMIKLGDVLAQNKYVLLDFWASWCGPCMREVPFLLEDYAKYHDKGFEIYGVSLDRSREPWVATMESKGLVWPNVSELKEWKDPSAKKYAVRSIPSNFLIASDGTIVARNLRGEELGAKLAELLSE